MDQENKLFLEHLRHTLAHLMASSLLEFYPEAKLTIGPAIENGFYYDVDFGSEKIGDEDLKKIQTSMRKNLKKWESFEHKVVTLEKAREIFSKNPYKLELIEEIDQKGEEITLYTCGGFTDLCRGGHLENPNKEIESDCFKLDRVAGAYWRGNEKNKMLTRIYGLAFENKERLDQYLKMREEAEARDHRKLGKELGLFTFSSLVGSGLPLWLPNGATVRRELERFIVDTELSWGYVHVNTPDIAKLDLYRTSGHYPYYKDSMYAPIVIDEDEFMLRPMTCPHHFQLFADSPKSYRDLPMRIAELAKLYRYEASGELSGLVRVRGFCLADAHIICADPEQAKDEVSRALDLIEYVSKVFGLNRDTDYWYRLSLGDRKDDKKYYKNDEAWETGEGLLREVLSSRNCKFVESQGEAAFYGPKIDVQMKDVRGKENTAFTVQYDFCMPDRFNLEYIAKDGTKKRPLVVHRSSIGAIERVMAFLIEHYNGAFPVWLAPIQVAILPVSNEAHGEYAKNIFEDLKKINVRTQMLYDESLGKRIRNAKMQKIPYIIIIGDKEIESKTITVEARHDEKIEGVTIDEFAERIIKEIKEKTLN